jgi:hypothetical protein
MQLWINLATSRRRTISPDLLSPMRGTGGEPGEGLAVFHFVARSFKP